ncbi:16336_t:CDS:2, partial [Gigaspora rosea]
LKKIQYGEEPKAIQERRSLIARGIIKKNAQCYLKVKGLERKKIVSEWLRKWLELFQDKIWKEHCLEEEKRTTSEEALPKGKKGVKEFVKSSSGKRWDDCAVNPGQ